MQKAARPRPHGVVKPATGVVCVLVVAAKDRLDASDGTSRDGCRRLVHALERRVVAGSDPGLWHPVGIRRETMDRGEVAGCVQPLEFGIGGGFGSQPGLGADGSEQVDARPEPARTQRVARPEIVFE